MIDSVLAFDVFDLGLPAPVDLLQLAPGESENFKISVAHNGGDESSVRAISRGFGACVLGDGTRLFAVSDVAACPTVSLPIDIVNVSVDMATGSVAISWESSRSRSYTLERSTDLISWDVLVSVSGTGDIFSFTDLDVVESYEHIFYRVLQSSSGATFE